MESYGDVLYQILFGIYKGVYMPIFKTLYQNEHQSPFSGLRKGTTRDFVPNGPIDNRAESFRNMAWHQRGAEPLSESLLTLFDRTYICVIMSSWLTHARGCRLIRNSFEGSDILGDRGNRWSAS